MWALSRVRRMECGRGKSNRGVFASRCLKFFCFIFFCLLFLFLTPPLILRAAGRAQETGEKITVVIDPGHGGENLGTTQNSFLEKSLTMTTAQAMYEELCKFEGVEVFLTRTEDEDISLKERAEFAAEKDADLLISIHYNASESHTLFGSEVWISLEPEYHAYGYQFATAALRQLRDLGMHLRGIKTRVDSKGKDYYGVIREAAALGVPAVIIEHCHVDQPEDSLHCDTEEEQRAFGVADAHAVAKYFGLKSDVLGVDYWEYPESLPEVSLTELVPRAKYDQTSPETCAIELSEAFYSEDRVLLSVSASDQDSNLIYYSYSLDGGTSFSKLQPWPEGDILTGEFENGFLLELEIPDGTAPDICLRVYNAYDLFTDSNVLHFTQEFCKAAEQDGKTDLQEGSASESADLEDGTSILIPADNPLMEKRSAVEDFLSVLKYLIPIVFLIFLILLILYLFTGGGHSGQTR